jgi:diadenosine tetraphosphatase ApaH/serine/threonine PP2A family protein phosphatase
VRYLIVSDLHSNWEALQAVLEEAQGKYEQILCCGDVVGYGADPNPVVEWVREHVKATVRGNHDRACVGMEDLEWFNPVAQAASIWTMEQLTPENADFIRGLPMGPVAVDNFQLIHGSPVDEDDYLVNEADASAAFPYAESSLLFFGHTHIQGGFRWQGGEVIQTVGRLHPEWQTRYLLEIDPECAYLLNPGSVGQPRDGDPRAAYAIYDTDGEILLFHRVPYDVESTQRKIREAGLPELLALRLAVGK